MEFQLAQDINVELRDILSAIPFDHVNHNRIIGIRSHGSKSRAIARIWSFPKVWQLALKTGPHYVIEVISERFDRLSEDDKKRTLIHELMHIPKNFSGALVPHRGRYKKIDRRSVEKLFTIYKGNR